MEDSNSSIINKSSKGKKNSKNKKSKFKSILLSTLYIGLFWAITTPLILIYGPFENTRKTVFDTVLATRHAYLITDLFSQDQIDNMLGRDTVDEDNIDREDIDLSKVEIKYGTSDEISKYTVSTKNFNGYILEVKNPKKVKVAMTKYVGKIGQKTSDMAKDNDAIAAINGGTFVDYSSDGTQYGGTGAEPGGFVISDGEIIFPPADGDYNKEENVIAFTEQGNLIVGDHTLQDMIDMDVKEAMCFRKTLILNGERLVHDKLLEGRNPRTAIGQKADGTVILLVTDGRKLSKLGATLYDVQEILMSRGAVNAASLDGGYSSTMYYDGEVVNEINAWDGERTVATAFYVEQ